MKKLTLITALILTALTSCVSETRVPNQVIDLGIAAESRTEIKDADINLDVVLAGSELKNAKYSAQLNGVSAEQCDIVNSILRCRWHGIKPGKYQFQFQMFNKKQNAYPVSSLWMNAASPSQRYSQKYPFSKNDQGHFVKAEFEFLNTP